MVACRTLTNIFQRTTPIAFEGGTGRLAVRLLHHLGVPTFQAKSKLLEAIAALLSAAGMGLLNEVPVLLGIQDNAVPRATTNSSEMEGKVGLLPELQYGDWPIRKAAAEALRSLCISLGPALNTGGLALVDVCTNHLQAARFDKVKPAREAIADALLVFSELGAYNGPHHDLTRWQIWVRHRVQKVPTKDVTALGSSSARSSEGRCGSARRMRVLSEAFREAHLNGEDTVCLPSRGTVVPPDHESTPPVSHANHKSTLNDLQGESLVSGVDVAREADGQYFMQSTSDASQPVPAWVSMAAELANEFDDELQRVHVDNMLQATAPPEDARSSSVKVEQHTLDDVIARIDRLATQQAAMLQQFQVHVEESSRVMNSFASRLDDMEKTLARSNAEPKSAQQGHTQHAYHDEKSIAHDRAVLEAEKTQLKEAAQQLELAAAQLEQAVPSDN